MLAFEAVLFDDLEIRVCALRVFKSFPSVVEVAFGIVTASDVVPVRSDPEEKSVRVWGAETVDTTYQRSSEFIR